MRIHWLLLCLPQAAWSAPMLRTEGAASLADGTPAYREVHWMQSSEDGAERWVEYLCPEGTPFARKRLPPSRQVQARGYQLQDRRSGQEAAVRLDGREVRVLWKESQSATTRTGELTLPDGAVIDAGFDAAVRLHWQALMRGEVVRMPFLVPGRQRFFPVKVVHRGAVRWQGIAAQSIEVGLDAWYGGVAPHLTLTYADTDRRLLEFRGTSNLRDAQGRYPQVVVRFATAPEPRDEALWRRAWAQPLVAACAVTRK
ncbi:TPA: hypothetical protein ACGY72_001192 [Stenotrophomonas maltophilia]